LVRTVVLNIDLIGGKGEKACSGIAYVARRFKLILHIIENDFIALRKIKCTIVRTWPAKLLAN